MSHDGSYGKPLTPDQERELQALATLIDDKEVEHKCENCGTPAMGKLTGLPLGWKYLALGPGWETLDAVDDATKLVCTFCVRDVETALKESKIRGCK